MSSAGFAKEVGINMGSQLVGFMIVISTKLKIRIHKKIKKKKNRESK